MQSSFDVLIIQWKSFFSMISQFTTMFFSHTKLFSDVQNVFDSPGSVCIMKWAFCMMHFICVQLNYLCLLKSKIIIELVVLSKIVPGKRNNHQPLVSIESFSEKLFVEHNFHRNLLYICEWGEKFKGFAHRNQSWVMVLMVYRSFISPWLLYRNRVLIWAYLRAHDKAFSSEHKTRKRIGNIVWSTHQKSNRKNKLLLIISHVLRLCILHPFSK